MEAKRDSFGWLLPRLFLLAVLINYPWELAQSPLYAGMNRFTLVWWHCLVASLGDGLLVVMIYAVGRWALGERFWFERPGLRGYALTLMSGLAIALIVEWIAVYVAGQWTYGLRMPTVPVLGVGVAPLLQMLILPPLIFRLMAWWLRRDRHTSD